jgi:tetratricopeptide (TPR) repeat protein
VCCVGLPFGARLIRLLCCVGLACFVCCVGLPAWRTADYCVAAAARKRRLALYVRAWQRESSSSRSAAAERQRELPLDFWLQEEFACLGETGRPVSRFLGGGTSVSRTLENCAAQQAESYLNQTPRAARFTAMILTHCAVCAAPLGLSLGKKCGRCSTRYCGAACQVQHWKEGGHDNLCKKIKKAGGAEQYNANTKYAEAVAVAAEACAEDTSGQTCYICTQALHWKTREGLVRGCACRGTAGFAHVSCLAEQAKILFAEAEENNLDWEVKNPRWKRWYECRLCEQSYHGVVRCALGWACWKTYLGRPETDQVRGLAMTQLGNGLSQAGRHEDALSVREAELAVLRRVGGSEERMLVAQGNLATTSHLLKRTEESMHLRREVYSGYVKLLGEEHAYTLVTANNYATILVDLQRFEEAKSLLRKTLPVARRVLGSSNDVTLRMRCLYANALYRDSNATLDDLREAVETFHDTDRIARRVLGSAHPTVRSTELGLQRSRARLGGYEARGIC